MNGTAFGGINLAQIKAGADVYDLVYYPSETPLLATAKKLGIPCAIGIGMLAA
jgi:shikimate dehydrogenase